VIITVTVTIAVTVIYVLGEVMHNKFKLFLVALAIVIGLAVPFVFESWEPVTIQQQCPACPTLTP